MISTWSQGRDIKPSGIRTHTYGGLNAVFIVTDLKIYIRTPSQIRIRWNLKWKKKNVPSKYDINYVLCPSRKNISAIFYG